MENFSRGFSFTFSAPGRAHWAALYLPMFLFTVFFIFTALGSMSGTGGRSPLHGSAEPATPPDPSSFTLMFAAGFLLLLVSIIVMANTAASFLGRFTPRGKIHVLTHVNARAVVNTIIVYTVVLAATAAIQYGVWAVWPVKTVPFYYDKI